MSTPDSMLEEQCMICIFGFIWILKLFLKKLASQGVKLLCDIVESSGKESFDVKILVHEKKHLL